MVLRGVEGMDDGTDLRGGGISGERSEVKS